MPSWMLQLDLPNRYTPWLVFQNARLDTGSSLVLLWTLVQLVPDEAFCAQSLYNHLISGPISPPVGGYFSAFARATCSLSVSGST